MPVLGTLWRALFFGDLAQWKVMERVVTGTLGRLFLLGPATSSSLILQLKHCNQMGSFQLLWLLEKEGCKHLTVALGSAASDFSSPARKGLINVGN